MTSLSVVHKNRDESGTDIKPRKTYFVGLQELYIEPGYNIRPIDPAHVEYFRDLMIDGEDLPPLAVKVTDKGLKIIDGHHRYLAALAATEAGHEIARLECKDAKGSEADLTALQIKSTQNKALSPIDRANGYLRMFNQGSTETEIAQKVKRSVEDVRHHLQLLECGDELIGMVQAGEVAATTAVSMTREFGTKAGAVAEVRLAEAKASGKKKLTKSAAMPQFSAKKARRLAELLVGADFTLTAGGTKALLVSDEVADEVSVILAEYRTDVRGDPLHDSGKALQVPEASHHA